jgi:hypothetical protein
MGKWPVSQKAILGDGIVETAFKDPESKEATRKRIADIAKRMYLGISDGQADPTGTQRFGFNVHYDGVAISPWEDDNRTYRIYLAYQTIEPLLVDDLPPSTRLAVEFHVALTLLHEFAVSVPQFLSRLMLIVSSMFWYLTGFHQAGLHFILRTIG